MTEEDFPPCYHDNRIRQLAAWILHPAVVDQRPEPAECLDWLISQPADAAFKAVMFRAVNLPVYGRDQWFLLGWVERTSSLPALVAPLPHGVDPDTTAHLLAGHTVRLEAARQGDLWDVAVTAPS